MVIMRGRHCLRHSCVLQSTVALSSAEAEYYALTKGAAYTMGTRSFFRDLRRELRITTLFTDSSSGLAFSSRRGLGRMRHIETRYLWLQDAVAQKLLKVVKVHTDENIADVLTKPISPTKMQAAELAVNLHAVE